MEAVFVSFGLAIIGGIAVVGAMVRVIGQEVQALRREREETIRELTKSIIDAAAVKSDSRAALNWATGRTRGLAPPVVEPPEEPEPEPSAKFEPHDRRSVVSLER